MAPGANFMAPKPTFGAVLLAPLPAPSPLFGVLGRILLASSLPTIGEPPTTYGWILPALLSKQLPRRLSDGEPLKSLSMSSPSPTIRWSLRRRLLQAMAHSPCLPVRFPYFILPRLWRRATKLCARRVGIVSMLVPWPLLSLAGSGRKSALRRALLLLPETKVNPFI